MFLLFFFSIQLTAYSVPAVVFLTFSFTAKHGTEDFIQAVLGKIVDF